MISKVIPIIILLIVVGINYLCINMARKNPGIIAGFKMSREPAQKSHDELWLKVLLRYMSIANTVTLIGGFIAIICGWQLFFILFLIVPICVAPLLSLRHRKKQGNKMRRMSTAILALLVIGLAVSPILYFCGSNLKVAISNNEIEISGLYGTEIPLSKIESIQLCHSLPQIAIRTNGFSFGTTRVGYFRTVGDEKICLFTHSNDIFICITQREGTTIYLSAKTEEETRQLFTKLQESLI